MLLALPEHPWLSSSSRNPILQMWMNVLLPMEDVIRTVITQSVPTIVPAILGFYWTRTTTDAQVMLKALNQNHDYFYHFLDHHECNTNHDNCDQHCHNTHGSFYCTCDSGWRLDPDGHTCNGMCYITSIIQIDVFLPHRHQ